MKRIIKNNIILVFIFMLCAQAIFAQENLDKINSLKDKIKASPAMLEAEPLFSELSDLSAEENQFNELYGFLVSLESNDVFNKEAYLYYYEALTRFKQMEYLQKNKIWQELFDNKNTYISIFNNALEKAEKLNTETNSLALRLKFIKAQFNKEDENLSINTLEDLYNLARQYAEANSDVNVVKEIADNLLKDKQTTYARKLYNVYVNKLSESDISKEDLVKIADEFLKENNIDLAVSLYDVYLDKLANSSDDKDAIIKRMFEIADKFRHTGWQDAQDPFFAEKIYDRINTLNIQAFDEISQYKRAYNLERIKEFDLCLQEYLKLVDTFPQYKDKDRIYFRIGVINAYIFGRIDEARKYFQKIVDEFPQSQDYFNSLYHLALLDHWQNNLEKAKELYKIILDKTKDYTQKPEITKMAQARLNEIEEIKPIEYNLRTFLEAVLVERERLEKIPYLQLELYVKDAKAYLDENVRYYVNSYMTETGCLQEDFTYLWSGNLGRNQNPFNKFEFETDYQDDLGTKVVNVVLVGPNGIVGGTIEMADIYNKEYKENKE
ncbi:MAG: tetratricopeptide repeat protein [Candidatus Omnitrophica bacterium]|nr:tetratricopeptide repeat protein [Candidatus Omnitrophota bacterium]